MRSRGPGLTASPTMVGALTVMVVILAVFLAYNANTGLPFVPTYRITVQVPERQHPGARQRGPRRRRAGRRGRVDRARSRRRTASSAPRLDLKLDRDVDPIPVDSTVIVRSRSALGLKYLEINLGDSDEGFEEGSVVPLSAADPGAGRARHRAQHVRRGDPARLAGEPARVRQRARRARAGAELGARPPARGARGARAGDAQPLLAGDQPGRVHPARSAPPPPRSRRSPRPRRRCSADLNVTFTALAEVARPFIQESITEGVQTERVTLDTLPRIRPFLANSAGLIERPRAGRRLAAPDLADDRRLARGGRAGPRPLRPAQPPAGADLRVAAAAQQQRRRPRRDHRRERRHRPARPGGQVHRPGADRLQLPRDPRRQLQRRRSPAATTSAPGSGSSSSTSPRAPTARAARRPGSPTAAGPTTRTSSTRTRTRTRRRRARRSSARPATSRSRPAGWCSATRRATRGRTPRTSRWAATDGAVLAATSGR